MISMSRAAFASALNPAYGPFLFATIGEDPNGKLLSVLSAFARRDIDPWQEADSLARMPRQSATVWMAEFISALPDSPNVPIPAKTIANDLVALLPQAMESTAPKHHKATEILTPNSSRLGFGFAAIAFLILIALLSWTKPAPRPETSASLPSSSEKASPRQSPSDLAH